MITFSDIAKELGVSKGTVSKAMSNAEDISPAMRNTILDKAVEMGYTRNRRAKGQPKLAIFICNMEYENPSDFGFDLVMGFRKAAEPNGYAIDVIPLTRELQNTMHYDSFMMQHNYLGAFFLGLSLSDPWLPECKTTANPTVLLDNHIMDNPLVTHVGVDNIDGMKLAVSYLKSLGHERIGYLGNALGSYVYRQRYDAYFIAMKEFGLPVDPDIVGTDLKITDCIYHRLPRLLEKGCTAIVCSHDVLANGAMTYCAELGKSVPKDISIIGFDDIPICEFTFPPLTTIRQDRTQIGKSAYSALYNHFQAVSIDSLLMHPKLICRSSCAPLEK